MSANSRESSETATFEGHYLSDLARRIQQSWPSTLPRETRYAHGRVPVTEYVRAWAREKPDAPAIIFYGAELSFRQLDRQSDAIASWLIGRGLRFGDRVALYLNSCPQFSIAFYGVLKAGCIVVPINAMAREMEVSHFLEDSGARAVIAQDTLLETLRASPQATGLLATLTTSQGAFLPAEPTLPLPVGLDLAGGPAAGADDFMVVVETPLAPLPNIAWDDPAVLNYTGGTTGLPKGCIHAHGDLTYTGASAATFTAPGANHVFLNFMPTFWIGGETVGMLLPMFAGSPVVLLTRWDAETVMAAIERYRVTSIALLVDGALEIMEHPKAHEFDLSSLRNTLAVSFVKVLNPEYRARWKAFAGTILRESAWGMTETNTMDTFTAGFQGGDFDLSGLPTFVGLPMPETEFKVVEPETGELRALGEEGELCVRTPSLFKGYWNNPEATFEAFRNGWLHTGDTAIIDHSGLVRFRGRKREMLKVNGMSVFPSEVEALLMRHPALAACGVVGRPDPKRGQAPVAFVQLAPGRHETVDSLEQWCRANIAVYKIPEIRILPSLPMTATGKVKRTELQALV